MSQSPLITQGVGVDSFSVREELRVQMTVVPSKYSSLTFYHPNRRFLPFFPSDHKTKRKSTDQSGVTTKRGIREDLSPFPLYLSPLSLFRPPWVLRPYLSFTQRVLSSPWEVSLKGDVLPFGHRHPSPTWYSQIPTSDLIWVQRVESLDTGSSGSSRRVPGVCTRVPVPVVPPDGPSSDLPVSHSRPPRCYWAGPSGRRLRTICHYRRTRGVRSEDEW